MSPCKSYVGTPIVPRASPKGTKIAPHGTTLNPNQVAASPTLAMYRPEPAKQNYPKFTSALRPGAQFKPSMGGIAT